MNSGDLNDYPMKWHKFLIYFSLWFGALANVVSGLRYITGTVYGADSERVYSVFPSMKSIDLVMGVILICMAASLIGLASLRFVRPAETETGGAPQSGT